MRVERKRERGGVEGSVCVWGGGALTPLDLETHFWGQITLK